MSCLDNLVTLGICPDDDTPLSGLTLLNAEGISINNLANIADEDSVSGINMAMDKKALSIIQLQNDLIAALHAQKVITSISINKHHSSNFEISKNNGLYNGYRGIVLHKAGQKGILRSLVIDSIELYPITSGTVTLKIDDGFNSYNLNNIAVTGGQINVLDKDISDMFPFFVNKDAPQVKITIDQSAVLFSKSAIVCHKGCHGAMPNDCGWVDGWDGTNAVKSEGFGINVNFHCECDYSLLLCSMPPTFIGELMLLKWQINIFKEQLMSNRFNNWVVYSDEKLNEVVIPDLTNQYNEKWNALMQGLPDLLRKTKDPCLNCKGSRWVVTI